MDVNLTLPGGATIGGRGPVVIIGANGSGKTRLARQVVSPSPREFVNALRSTRVAPEIPAWSRETAINQLNGQRNQAETTHWELQNDFDALLATLYAEDAAAAIADRDAARRGEPISTELTHLEQIRELWSEVFPGRKLYMQDNRPRVKSVTGEEEIDYSAFEMSDAERAALYLAGKVFLAQPGVIMIDEPEMHFHSLLAVQLMDALEQSRQDLRFVYITHDVTFGLSRRDATFVLATPRDGLQVLDVPTEVSAAVNEAILGAASFSFYARRVVFCEGDEGSLDALMYKAWFDDKATVVVPVGSCHMVLQCTSALHDTGIATGADVIGIIDRDFHPDAFLGSVPDDVVPLDLHEVESLFCLPDVVAAVATQVGASFDGQAYDIELRRRLQDEALRRKVILERWKRVSQKHLEGLLSGVNGRTGTIEGIIQDLPTILDYRTWGFSLEDMLRAEQNRVDAALASPSLLDAFRMMPGKPFVDVAARSIGMTVEAYELLVGRGLKGDQPELQSLSTCLRDALRPHLPSPLLPVAS